MIVVIPLTVQIDYTELKYCLRSLEKFLPEPFEVVIVGELLPEWITNVTQIELPDVPGKKQLSIRRKVLAALEYANEFLFFNDDMYLLKPQSGFPYYFHGILENNSEPGARQLDKQLKALKKPFKNFDGHYPLMYSRHFIEAQKGFSDDCIIKSMYANYYSIPGELMADCKIIARKKPEDIREFIKNRSCFSTGIYSLESCLPVLKELFPNKSKLEI